ncbi:MAG: hypothetical protein RL748_2904 [Pseudomonadota bacterium]|jgi:sodium transport system permease protein
MNGFRGLRWVIFLKEFRDALRDRRSLMTLIGLVVFMPSIIAISLHFVIVKVNKDERESIRLLVKNGDQAPTLLASLKEAGITVEATQLQKPDKIAEKLEDGKIAGLLALDEHYKEDYLALRPAKMALWSNSGKENHAQLAKIKRVIQKYEITVAQWRMVARGVSTDLLQPVDLQEYDSGGQGARTGALVGMFFGMLFWSVFSIGVTMVIDMTAGERERRTLELLIAQPASSWDVVTGKWLAAALFAFIGLSLELALTHFYLLALPLEEIGMSWQMGLPGLILLLLTGLPLSLFSSSMIMALAMNTKTFKEAQSAVGLAIMVPMLPTMIVPYLELGRLTWLFAIPMVGHAEMVKGLIKGDFGNPLEWLLLIGSPLLAALALVLFCVRRLRSERFVVGI